MNKMNKKFRVGMHAGKPALFEGDRPVVLPSYCAMGPGFSNYPEAVRRFARHGCTTFWLMPTGGYNGEWGTSPFWTAPGQINESPVPMPEGYFGLDQQAAFILSIVPEARFFVRMMDMPPESWAKTNPDDMLLNYRGERYPIPSYASERYLEESSAFFTALARYCERQTWAERIIGSGAFFAEMALAWSAPTASPCEPQSPPTLPGAATPTTPGERACNS